MNGSLWEYASCTGGADCPSHVHVHGCFRDDGTCDDPGSHDPVEKMRRLQGFLENQGIGVRSYDVTELVDFVAQPDGSVRIDPR